MFCRGENSGGFETLWVGGMHVLEWCEACTLGDRWFYFGFSLSWSVFSFCFSLALLWKMVRMLQFL